MRWQLWIIFMQKKVFKINKEMFLIDQVDTGPYSHLPCYLFLWNEQAKNIQMEWQAWKVLHVIQSGKVEWALSCTHATWPFFPAFDSQVPHLTFYEHLKILWNVKDFSQQSIFQFFWNPGHLDTNKVGRCCPSAVLT